MKCILTGLLSIALLAALAALAAPSDARNGRKSYRYNGYYADNSPGSIRESQRYARTFDETQYYERQASKVPFGTPTWWDQVGPKP
jgi:hypothetical protein